MMATDDAQEALVPVRGFFSNHLFENTKVEMWLPSPWDVHPMQGGLDGNKEFEEAAIEARSESSKWVEVLVKGKLGKNNALKLAGAKQASALLFSAI